MALVSGPNSLVLRLIRAVIGQLFQQEMRGHLGPTCHMTFLKSPRRESYFPTGPDVSEGSTDLSLLYTQNVALQAGVTQTS